MIPHWFFWRWQDRKHWELDVWRLGVYRWCDGSPCEYPGADRRQRHPVRVTWQR